ncbi:MAG TPA: hypothetical protein VKH65_16800 [Myxococcales bacterium]|nr:hypothetical protein [Myxococcales bacterium]
MADRFSRFLKLERPHQRGEQQTPVVNADRFAPEEQRTPGSGIAIDEEPADAQPFLRCARCEMDNTRFAATCANCGAQLHTPEQELYNRQLWQKRRAEAAAEAEAVKKMHQPPPPVEAELAQDRLRAQDPRYTLGEVLAREVADHEEARLGWMGGGMNVPFGIRAVAALSPRWRWRAGGAVALWLAGTGLAALHTHHPTPMWLFFGTLAVLLAFFMPARPRRRYWWSSGWW